MAEEIQQAVQIIRVAYDGIEIAMKIGTGTIEQMKKAVDMLSAILEYEKTMGKTDMRKLLLKGGDLQVLQFASEERKRVEKMAKQYGLLYSILPDINKADGMSEIVFHTEAVPRVNMMVQKLKSARIATLDDYLQNGTQEELENLLEVLKGKNRGSECVPTNGNIASGHVLDEMLEKVGQYTCRKQSICLEEITESFQLESEKAVQVLGQLESLGVVEKTQDGEWKALIGEEEFNNRVNGYEELLQRMETISAVQDKNILHITVAKKLIMEENDHAIKTRVPGMWGENAAYIWLPKEYIKEIHDGKTILTYLDADKEYKLYSADNRVIGTRKGSDLYENHYDQVSREVNERYVKAAKRNAPGKSKGKQTLQVKR